MTLERPDYWLAYVSAEDDRTTEITATAPCCLDRPRFSRDARVLLAAAGAYHDAHPDQRVVFVAAVTRWLLRARELSRERLGIDFEGALDDLDRHAPALLIEASPLARAVVADSANHLTIHYAGGGMEDGAIHTEPCRAAILAALERDWPAFIRRVVPAR